MNISLNSDDQQQHEVSPRFVLGNFMLAKVLCD